MKWLLFVVAVTANGAHITISKTEFQTRDLCTAAAAQLHGINSSAIGANARIEATCLQTQG